MPLFTATAELWTMHEGKIVDEQLAKFQNAVMSQAIQVFLKAVLKRIPVRTGFLSGAFTEINARFNRAKSDLNPILAAFLGADNKPAAFLSPETRDVFAEREKVKDSKLTAQGKARRAEILERDKRANFLRQKRAGQISKDRKFREWYYPAGKGSRIEKTPRSGIKFATPADQVLKVNGLTSTIKIDVQISYYRINDFYSKVRGAPWMSMDAGFIAMLNFLNIAAQKFPYITEILATQKIFLRGSSVTKGQVASYKGNLSRNPFAFSEF